MKSDAAAYDLQLARHFERLEHRFTSNGFMAARVPAGPSKRNAPSNHHVIGVNFEAMKVEEGIDNRPIMPTVVPADSIGYIPAGTKIRLNATVTGPRIYVVFNNTIINRYFGSAAMITPHLEFMPFTPFPEGAMIGRAIEAALLRREECTDAYLESLCASLVLCVLQQYDTSQKVPTGGPGRLSERRIRKVVELIEDRFAEDLSLDEMADAAALSRYYFARQFKSTFDQSPHAYLMERRLSEVQKLLKDRDLPLAEIAARCGFSSQSHLTTAFRSRFDATPAAWRREVVQ